MLRKLELSDAYVLHGYLVESSVYPYVRYKAETLDEYLFLTKQLLEQEEAGELIVRVIANEAGEPIGQIYAYAIENGSGYIGTWIASPYHGKGYNALAKASFFSELFYDFEFERVYLKVRKSNHKSRKALLKFPYVTEVPSADDSYDYFVITKEDYGHFEPNQLEA